ncbi:hypothetical protein [uncultured Roseibium sp.]|uniref:hypothetical protein n=1 Tax=uncultured Roseibium sp. TaxID=1936171 RepID=UPI002607338B|nr:hypothetical protein [uncultured Roseibium sp.]
MNGHPKPLLNGDVENFGFRLLGPYLVSFCDWLHSIQNGAGNNVRLLFVARDGYLPHLVYRTLYPEHAEQCAYVVASRLSAQLCDIKDEAAATAWLTSAARSAGLLSCLKDAVGSPTQLDGRQLCKLAETHRTAQQSQLAELIGAATPVVVDIGYGGSTQAIFAQLLQGEVQGAYLVTHKAALATELEAGAIQAFDAANIEPHGRTSLVNRHRYFFEAVLSEPKGSFLFFSDPSKPVFEPFEPEEQSSRLLKKIRQGAERYAQEVASGQRSRLPPAEAKAGLQRFLDHPHPGDAVQFAGLDFNDRLKGVERRYVVIPPDKRRDAFGLWVEGQLAADQVSSSDQSHSQHSPCWRLSETRFMLAGLSTAQFACYATNRPLFKAQCGGLIGMHVKALMRLVRSRFES